MSSFIDLMIYYFNQLYEMLVSDSISAYFNGASIFIILVMFYAVWQIIYLFVIRPSSSVGAVELYQQHQRNSTREERRLANAMYRRERDQKMDAYRDSVMSYHKSKSGQLENGRSNSEYDEFWDKALARSNSIINGE